MRRPGGARFTSCPSWTPLTCGWRRFLFQVEVEALVEAMPERHRALVLEGAYGGPALGRGGRADSSKC